jgi:hypothetical protein
VAAAPDAIDPASHRVRPVALVLPGTVRFYEAAAGALVVKEGAEQVSV